MRVIAGTFRSRVLKEVEEFTTRETKDRVKESIFNSIQTHLPDATVLDLFGGSGSLGIEAISRGARYCEFVDHNKKAIETMKDNIKTLNIEQSTNIVQSDYKTYLRTTNKAFDVILLDPPYSLEKIDDMIQTITEKKILKEDGLIVCLYSKNISIKEDNNGIIEYKQKKIGVTKVSFMKWGI